MSSEQRIVPDKRNGFRRKNLHRSAGLLGARAYPNPADDPLGIGVNQAVLKVLNQYPGANEGDAGDGSNTLGFRFSPNVDRSFNTYINPADYHITSSGSQPCLCAKRCKTSRNRDPNSFPGSPPLRTFWMTARASHRTHLTPHPQAHQRFSLGLHPPGAAVRWYLCVSGVFLNGIDNLVPFTRPTTCFCARQPVERQSELDAGKSHASVRHRFISDRNNHISYLNSFSDVQTKCGLISTPGGIANDNSPLDPKNNINPATGKPYSRGWDSNFGPNYDSATAIVMGYLWRRGTAFNILRRATAAQLPRPSNQTGVTPSMTTSSLARDSWRINRRLTVSLWSALGAGSSALRNQRLSGRTLRRGG